jgi:hypothetical protein
MGFIPLFMPPGALSGWRVHLAARPADASHSYGYERYELLAAMGIAVLMLAAVWGILDHAWTRFRFHDVPSQNLNPDVLMMKPAEDWYCCDAADLLRTPKSRRILAQ